MILSRRNCCLAALGTAMLPAGYWAARSATLAGRRENDAAFADYHSTLVNGRTPGHVAWDSRKWRCAMGSTWNAGMDHCLRLTPERARFEIRDSQRDRGPNDDAGKRRSEIRFPKRPRLPNGIPLWGAFSFRHHRWADPEGMAKGWGGAHGQLHIGSGFGGSPAVAFRRTRKGEFGITTRGENADKNLFRYRAPLAFDEVHHLVYRVTLDPLDGALRVWLNGQQIVDVAGVSIGSHHAECYWSMGCYYSGGITCPIVAEYGDHFYPSPGDLSSRLRFRPRWG